LAAVGPFSPWPTNANGNTGVQWKQIYQVEGAKDLSFCELKLWDTAHELFIKELAAAKSCDDGEIEQELEKIFPS